MDRRVLLASGLSLIASKAFAQQPLPPAAPANPGPPQGYQGPPPAPAYQGPPSSAPRGRGPEYPAEPPAEAYTRDELVNSVSDFFGVTSEAAGAIVTKIFKDNGRPTGYIAGEEASGALTVGLRYGKGLLYMKNRAPEQVFWQGPSIGFDIGGNAARTFTLCYDIQHPAEIYQRFPGVEGSAYFIAGLGVNYQRSDTITLAPIRTGVGLRWGANIGYLAYSRKRHILPL